MLGARPFVYLSEAVVASNRPLGAIHALAARLGAPPAGGPELVEAVWAQAALSVRAQAARYGVVASPVHEPGTKAGTESLVRSFRPQRNAAWLAGVADRVAGAFRMDAEQRRAFVAELPPVLTTLRGWSIAPDAREFVARLDDAGILWGVIANDDHLFPSVLKALGLKPWTIVSAREGFFKPLPQVFARAHARVPKASRGDVWFVGSVHAPYDNVTSPHIRNALYTYGSVSDVRQGWSADSVRAKSHFRIASLDELLPLIGAGPKVMGGNYDFIRGVVDDDDLEPAIDTLPENDLLPLGEKELALADLPGGAGSINYRRQ